MTRPPAGDRRPASSPSPAPDPRREAVRAFTDRCGEPPGAAAPIPPPGAETTVPAPEPPARPPAG